MRPAEKLLHILSRPRVRKQVEMLRRKDAPIGIEYSKKQYKSYLNRPLDYEIEGKTIIEIGCGHGGISCFLAINGAKMVYGIDLNESRLESAQKFKNYLCEKYNTNDIPVGFIKKSAEKLDFDDNSIDLIIADNVFEHFDDNVSVLKECRRVLKPGGQIISSSFPSIYSKNGPHLKKGVAVPWCYLFFSEKTIVNVLKKNASEFPILKKVYGGLNEQSETIRDVRDYHDLNYLTYRKLKNQIHEAGLRISSFRIHYINLLSKIIASKLTYKYWLINDILSNTASARITKDK